MKRIEWTHDDPVKARVLDIKRGGFVLIDDVIFELVDGSRVRLSVRQKDASLVVGDEGYLTYHKSVFKGWTAIR